uniref:Uncharacterized protein n=1 Tax=Amphimedon queenslandica TaxID=400682 RepID=A0A1X7U529_AMPQE
MSSESSSILKIVFLILIKRGFTSSYMGRLKRKGLGLMQSKVCHFGRGFGERQRISIRMLHG